MGAIVLLKSIENHESNRNRVKHTYHNAGKVKEISSYRKTKSGRDRGTGRF